MSKTWLLDMEAIGNATFDGSESSIEHLKSLIGNGGFVHAHGESAYEMMKRIEEPIYSQLILLVWSNDNNDKARNPSGIVIVDSDTA
ncbi:hypothetical protein V491_07491 [Pseudogymnoascus sp. VKM F-3775]|nr:hypothetical protein V491_07491 [Pseudogymnoascus sp. VKM F-3775]